MGIQTVGCRRCGLVLTNPQPSEAALDRFYREHYRRFYQRVDQPDLAYVERLRKDGRSRATVEFLISRDALPAAAKVLDVGASEGAMLRAIADLRPDTTRVAVEPNPAFRAFAESYADCTVHASLSELEGQTFDLVIVNHVLEHVREPVPFLQQLAAVLHPTGHLYIDVPNVIDYSSLQDFHIAHLYHFGPASLRRLVRLGDFAVEFAEAHRPVMHPPSIRALCVPVGDDETARPDGSDHAGREGWEACRTAGRKVWQYRLRRSPAGAVIGKARRVLSRRYQVG
jgi:SAM-dependent methyltransferase